MDNEPSRKDLRTAEARQRCAARSVRQKNDLGQPCSDTIARDSAIRSLPPVVASVDPPQLDPNHSSLVPGGTSMDHETNSQSDLHINSSLPAAVRLTRVQPACNLPLPALLTEGLHVHSENASGGPIPPMIHEPSKKALRNAKARQRYAARSQQKLDLARNCSAMIASDSALCSLPPVVASVDPPRLDPTHSSLVPGGNSMDYETNCQSDLHINSSLPAAVRLTCVQPASNLPLLPVLTDGLHVHSEESSVGPTAPMDHELSKKDLRNAKARQRYAARSVQKKLDLVQTRRATIACESVVRSLPPVLASVDLPQCDPDYISLVPGETSMDHEAAFESDLYISSSLPATVHLTCVEPASDLPFPALLTAGLHVHSEKPYVGPLLVNDLHAAPSDLPDVRLRTSSVCRLIDPSSLSFAFETGQTSGCSSKVSNGTTVKCPSDVPSQSQQPLPFVAPASSVPHVITRQPGRPRRVVDRFARLRDVPTVPWVLPAVGACVHCGARRFFREGSAFCCSNGQICLPKSVVCSVLHFLFTDLSEIACEFRRRARTYNNAFAFTSIGMSTDSESWWAKEGKYALKVFGQVFHYMNPVSGSPNTADLLQLFFLDSVDELDSSVISSRGLRADVMDLIVQALSVNPYTKFFKRLRSWENLPAAHVVLRSDPCRDPGTYNLPTVDEVAAVWNDTAEGDLGRHRDIRVYTSGSRGHQIKYFYSCYDSLQYPILFPYGELGWHSGIKKRKLSAASSSAVRSQPCVGLDSIDPSTFASAEEVLLREDQVMQENRHTRSNVSCREFTCYRAQMRNDDNSYLLHSGRLGHQFWIDSYIKLETSRFDYYRSDQTQQQYRIESLQGIVDSLCIDGETNPANVGKRVLLPSSFIGGPRDMRKRYVNAMALVQKFGKPDLFLTMTCNPSWKEIADNLLPCELPHDRPDLIARVFKAKLEELKDEIMRKKLFGEVAGYVYTVEYQKRGLPHVHWVIILADRHKIVSADVYDRIISAEIPDNSHPFLRSYVLRHMMHGPCGDANPNNVCMRDGQCRNHYPKQFSDVTTHGQGSYPCYRRRDDGRTISIRNVPLDNTWVIPHCPRLLAKFDCHINVEICSDIRLVKYLYKYIYKGHDKAAYHVVSNNSDESYDEIQSYQSARYICAPEAFWRIFAFPMSEIYPPVIVLPVHLPGHQPLRFGLTQSLEKLAADPQAAKTMLTEFLWMNMNNSDARRLNLLYKEFPEHFVWDGTRKKWNLRKKQTVVGRLSTVSPFEGERYFERLLLMHVRCPTSFDQLKTVASGVISTFRESAVFKGLLASDNYADSCLEEAAFYQMPCSLRKLFALLLVYGVCGSPQNLWDKFYGSMSEDFSQSRFDPPFVVQQKTIAAIDNFLSSLNKSISDFSLRFAVPYVPVYDRMSREYEFEKNMIVSKEDRLSVGLLNTQQKIAYKRIVSRILSGQGGAFFVDGPGGTGKTFLYRALLAFVRLRKKIALAVATSGVAAALLPGGRTAHSRFKLPLNIDDKSVGSISKQTSLAKMIVAAELIVWDEATMANRCSIEALDTMLQDLCSCRSLFGGKVVLFGGDFRQTLPIVVRGGRDAMIAASIVSWSKWPLVVKLRLHENMRAREDPDFVEYLMRIGNGSEPFVFDDFISVSPRLYIPFLSVEESLNRLVDYVFPSLQAFQINPQSYINRAILTPKNDSVEEINDMLIEKFPGPVKEYVSYNNAIDSMQQGEYEDYLNGVSVSGLPPHLLKLKVNSPIMLLRNLNPVEGLCNGTRLICKELGDTFIGAEIAVGEFKGNHVFIPRIPLECTDKIKCPIAFKRTQFPVRPCFAMTINKAQGQTLDYVGIYLRQPVFSHGQLYVALSRARNGASVKILIHPVNGKGSEQGFTKNVVFPEIFVLAQGFLLFTLLLALSENVYVSLSFPYILC